MPPGYFFDTINEGHFRIIDTAEIDLDLDGKPVWYMPPDTFLTLSMRATLESLTVQK